eukprot:1288657-Rhodomonas_salina.1
MGSGVGPGTAPRVAVELQRDPGGRDPRLERGAVSRDEDQQGSGMNGDGAGRTRRDSMTQTTVRRDSMTQTAGEGGLSPERARQMQETQAEQSRGAWDEVDARGPVASEWQVVAGANGREDGGLQGGGQWSSDEDEDGGPMEWGQMEGLLSFMGDVASPISTSPPRRDAEMPLAQHRRAARDERMDSITSNGSRRRGSHSEPAPQGGIA